MVDVSFGPSGWMGGVAISPSRCNCICTRVYESLLVSIMSKHNNNRKLPRTGAPEFSTIVDQSACDGGGGGVLTMHLGQ